MATITKSIWGKGYNVEYVIGGCCHHAHFDTYQEAINFTKKTTSKL